MKHWVIPVEDDPEDTESCKVVRWLSPCYYLSMRTGI